MKLLFNDTFGDLRKVVGNPNAKRGDNHVKSVRSRKLTNNEMHKDPIAEEQK